MGTYTKSSTNRAARPRSERLRQLGGTIVSTSTSVMGGGAGYVPSGSGHSHANLDSLNMITVEEGYIYLTDTFTDETTGDQVTETVKASVGYADKAGSNAAGYTLDWFIPVTVNGSLTLKLNPIYAGIWAEGWITAGGIGAGGGGGGGASFLSELGDVSLSSPASGNLLAYNGTVWVNIPQSSVTPDLTGYATQSWVTGQGYITNESDPVFSASAAAGITSSDITSWNNKTSNTGTVTSVTLTSGTGITVTNSGTAITTSGSRTISISSAFQVYIEHGQNAYEWGDHANAGYLTAIPVASSSVLGGIKLGFLPPSIRDYAVKLDSENKAYVNVPWTDTVYTHPTDGANTTITAANGKVLSAITVNNLGHVTSVSSKTLAKADIPALDYLPLTGGELTGDLWLHTGSSNYGSKLWFGDKGSGDGYVYLHEDTDDHLHIHADKGLQLSTGSNYGIQLDNKVTLNSSRSFTFGNGVLTWDANINAWKLSGNLVATGFITAGAANPNN